MSERKTDTDPAPSQPADQVISVDAMGGDNGPAAVVAGLKLFFDQKPDARAILHGDAQKLKPLTAKHGLEGRVSIQDAPDVVQMTDKPSHVLRHGKSSSMWSAIDAVRDGKASVAVSCGNTGALMAMSMLRLRKAEGVNRPAIACLWPSYNKQGFNVMLDAGADDCLTGGVDVRELAVRIRQAIEVGGKPESGPGLGAAVGGTVSRSVFDDELRRRAADPTLGVFGVVLVRVPEVSTEELGRILADEIRNEEGDLVSEGADGFLVLLQGARGDAAQAFLNRFRNRLAHHFGWDPRPVLDVFSHPADRVRMFNFLDGQGSR